MNKRQASQWECYLSRIVKYGQRDLHHAYGSFSSKKYNAWCSIRSRVVVEKGFGFTVTSAGSHYFSTDYIRRVDNQPFLYEWVHDSASGTTCVQVTPQMVSELKSVGIYDPWR